MLYPQTLHTGQGLLQSTNHTHYSINHTNHQPH